MYRALIEMLRMTHATSKGGKTLVVPTPYAVKMALLDVCFRRFPAREAPTNARNVFEWIKSREVRIRPPKHCLVTNTFVKVLDWNRDGDDPFRPTIAYRELAFYGGDDLLIALDSRGLKADQRSILTELFATLIALVNAVDSCSSQVRDSMRETCLGDSQYPVWTSPRTKLWVIC